MGATMSESYCRSSESDSESEEELAEPVTLHIYNVSKKDQIARVNDVLYMLGTGIFHAAVEVYGREWSFGKSQWSGVFSNTPTRCRSHKYREAVLMGTTSLSQKEVQQLLTVMKAEWKGPEYDLLRHNCTHFSNDFCERLGVGPVPRWVTNLGAAGATVRGGVVMIKDVAMAPFVLAAAKAGDIEDSVRSILAAGKRRRHASENDRMHFRDPIRGLVYHFGDLTFGALAVATAHARGTSPKRGGFSPGPGSPGLSQV
eukprot:TRINITY_DN29753_c0_g1_i3.p1 TRINITY_DN29753_c0_g1~~TRINITY_DN29753_c0_g1_i3.p1  ORF type:complete len:280 (-),score=23.85 TRINITY_DN29753_c0_g1_i3:35-805(-)